MNSPTPIHLTVRAKFKISGHMESQARNQRGRTGCARTPIPTAQQAPKVCILTLNIQVKGCSRLNGS